MRLFAGIALDDRTRAACADVARRLEAGGFHARFIEPENFHITLAFLGNVDASRYDEIVATLDAAASGVPAFSLALDKLGAFPHERRPRIVYVGARETGSGFRTLAGAVRERYAAMGFAFDDDSVAHVTIARIKGGSPVPLPMRDVAEATLRVNDVVLFESLRVENATRYAVRHISAMKS